MCDRCHVWGCNGNLSLLLVDALTRSKAVRDVSFSVWPTSVHAHRTAFSNIRRHRVWFCEAVLRYSWDQELYLCQILTCSEVQVPLRSVNFWPLPSRCLTFELGLILYCSCSVVGSG